jgi:hypothetical protein
MMIAPDEFPTHSVGIKWFMRFPNFRIGPEVETMRGCLSPLLHMQSLIFLFPLFHADITCRGGFKPVQISV